MHFASTGFARTHVNRFKLNAFEWYLWVERVEEGTTETVDKGVTEEGPRKDQG
jgi:hypothetical protein